MASFPTVISTPLLQADRSQQADAILSKLGDPAQAARSATADKFLSSLPDLPSDADLASSAAKQQASQTAANADMSTADMATAPTPSAAPTPAPTSTPTPSPSAPVPDPALADQAVAKLGPLPGTPTPTTGGTSDTGTTGGSLSPLQSATPSPSQASTPAPDTGNASPSSPAPTVPTQAAPVGASTSATPDAALADQIVASLPPLPGDTTSSSAIPAPAGASTAATSVVSSPPLPVSPSLSSQGSTSGDAIDQGIAKADPQLVATARQAATAQGVDPNIFTRLIYQESRFNPNAHNASGADGIAQLEPSSYPNVDARNPGVALNAAASTIADNLKTFGGDYASAIAAYNAGVANVQKYGLAGVLDPSFAGGQTRDYVNAIMGKQTGQTTKGTLDQGATSGNNQSRADSGVTSPLAPAAAVPLTGMAADGAPGNVASSLGAPPPTAPTPQSRNLISNQFDYQKNAQLTPEEAASACGPTAALEFARYAGRNPTIGEALNLAKSVGWTPSLGMAGGGSEVSLLGKMGVDSTYHANATPQSVSDEVQAGRPVILDTPQHYFAVDGFNPQTGQYHVGGSGLALRGGSDWMTWAQINQQAGGVRGSITVNTPSDPGALTSQATSYSQDRNPDAYGAYASNLAMPVPDASNQREMAGANPIVAPPPLTPTGHFTVPTPKETPSLGATTGAGGEPVPRFGPDPYGGMGPLAPTVGQNLDLGSISNFQSSDPQARLRAVEQGLNVPSQAVRAAIEPDVANGGSETTPQRLLRYWNQTDPNATVPKRLEQVLSIADTVNDPVVAKVLRDDPSGAVPLGLLTAAERTVTNPLAYAGMPAEAVPSLALGGTAGALGAGALASRGGASPQDVYQATQGGFNVGMGAGPIAETAGRVGLGVGRAALAAAPTFGRGLAAAGQAGAQGVRDALGPGPLLSGGSAPSEAQVAASTAAQTPSFRFYHGTGSAFDSPEAAKFDPNGLFGPGYYLTSDARVASSYSDKASQLGGVARAIASAESNVESFTRTLSNPKLGATDRQAFTAALNDAQQHLDSLRGMPQPTPAAGPNVRAVNVPSGLKLLNADQWIGQPEETRLSNAIAKQFGDGTEERFSENLGAGTGQDVWRALNHAIEGDPEIVNQFFQAQGYDGIQYNGGQRVPLADAAGAPIQHQAVVIFPDSLPKITNAISGRPMGSPATVGGAVAGGVIGSQQPAQNDQERARNIAAGALGGGLLMHGIGAAARGESLPFGMSVKNVGGEAEAAAGAEGNAARAGNILLNKYVNPDVQQIIADAAARDPAAMEAARRGVVPDATVQALADASGTTIQKVIARWKPGNAENAETISAMRSALDAKGTEVGQLAKVADASGKLEDQLNLQLAIREQTAIQEAVTGVTAEAGRSVRVFRTTVQSAIASGDQANMAEILKRLGGVEWTADLAKKLSQLDPADKFGRYQFLRDAMKPQLHDYLTELWYNAMLSGPRTHFVKSMSETFSLLLSPVERGFSAAVEAPLAAIQGRPPARFFGEVKPEVFGMVQGIPEGISKALFTIQHGYRLSDVLNGTDYVRTAAFRGPVGAVINFPSRTMAAAAEFSAAIAESGALNSGAYRQARIEGLNGDALVQRIADLRQNPTPALMKYARDQGQYRVYQQAPGKTIQAIATLRDSIPLGIGRVLLPFLQTPANLVKFGLERSPVGALNPHIYTNLAKRSPEAADQIGRWAMGSMVAGGIALMAAKGDITGPAPTNPGERDAWTRTGKQPFAIRIGDKYYNYQKLEPLNQTFSQVASLVDAINQRKNVTDTVGQVVGQIGTNLVSQTYMQSLAGALNAVDDPARYGGRFIDGLVGSTVPAVVRIAAQNVDPTMRQTQGPLEGIQAEIPGQSQNLPPRLNAFGEPIQRDTSNISPVAVSQATTSPVEQELARYGVEPGLTGKAFKGLDLTRQEQADLQAMSGPLVKQALTQTVADPRYAALDDFHKAKALRDTITKAKDQAATLFGNQMLQQQGQAAIQQRIKQKQTQSLPPQPVAP